MDNKLFYRPLLQARVRGADHLRTESDASLQDIMSLLSVSADGVANIYRTSELPAQATGFDATAYRNRLSRLHAATVAERVHAL